MEEIIVGGARAGGNFHVRLASFICFESPPRPSPRRTLVGGAMKEISPGSPRRRTSSSVKRKQENPCDGPAYIEPCLVQLCRQSKWSDVLRRCEFPHDSSLYPIQEEALNNRLGRHATKRSILQDYNQSSDDCLYSADVAKLELRQPEDPAVAVYRETALGIACASKDVVLVAAGGEETARCVIRRLVEINPHQIAASQLLPGHTALRDAVLNEIVSPEVLEFLIEAHVRCSDDASVFHMEDRNGLSPLDHLIVAVHLGSSVQALERLKVFVKKRPLKIHQSTFADRDVSPLIRLLTMGNSYTVDKPTSLGKPSEMDPSSQSESKGTSHTGDTSRLERILEAAQCLLDDDPSLLCKCSRVTGCSPIHIALRNYGNFEKLIQELMLRDPLGRMMKMRNNFGDLPLHVASSVGVPLNVLLLVLNQTIQAENSDSFNIKARWHSLVWSVNHSGYTPVDLEWIRHIESGNGILAARSFYPLEATGVRKHCRKQDEFYKKLLREAVDQVMQTSNARDGDVAGDGTVNFTLQREEEARAIFGSLLDRISVLVRSAATGSVPNASSLTVSASLADVCKLSTPYTPNFPLPLSDLYLWFRSEEVMKRDCTGKLPMHQLLTRGKKLDLLAAQPSAIEDWMSFVFQLLDKSSEQLQVRSQSGRLPLHYALDHFHSTSPAISWPPRLQACRHAVIERLVEDFPESVDKKDPISGFYPYMMASMDPSLSLDTVFCLLRRSPSLCAPSTTHKNKAITRHL